VNSEINPLVKPIIATSSGILRPLAFEAFKAIAA